MKQSALFAVLPLVLALAGCRSTQPLAAMVQVDVLALVENSQPGDVISVPPGTYDLPKTLFLENRTLTGPGATLRVVNPPDAKKYRTGVQLKSGAILRDIAVTAEGPRCLPTASGSTGIQVRHVRLRGGTILLDANAPDVNNLLVEGCDFHEGGYGILLDAKCTGSDVRIIGNRFLANRSDAIELNFPHKEKGQFIRDVVISGNLFLETGGNPNSGTSGFGVGVAGGHNIQITGNTFRKCGVQGIHLEDHTENVAISGNTFEECGLGCTTRNWTGGIHILSGTRNVAVTGNTFTRCRFAVSGLQGYTLKDIAVVGNTIRDCERGGWFMQYPRGVFEGNHLLNCQIGLELWRSPNWIVSNNQFLNEPPEKGADADAKRTVALRFHGLRNVVCTGNLLDADIAIDHRNKTWSDTKYRLDGNVIVRGKHLRNETPQTND
jgi:parallel beta-helix repeat protein